MNRSCLLQLRGLFVKHAGRCDQLLEPVLHDELRVLTDCSCLHQLAEADDPSKRIKALAIIVASSAPCRPTGSEHLFPLVVRISKLSDAQQLLHRMAGAPTKLTGRLFARHEQWFDAMASLLARSTRRLHPRMRKPKATAGSSAKHASAVPVSGIVPVVVILLVYDQVSGDFVDCIIHRLCSSFICSNCSGWRISPSATSREMQQQGTLVAVFYTHSTGRRRHSTHWGHGRESKCADGQICTIPRPPMHTRHHQRG